jgi:ribosomal protein S18 acetylase RimI-like enzyme
MVSLGRIDAAEPTETACELLSRSAESLRRAGVLVAQTLLETDHGPQADRFEGAGFRHVANLLFLSSSRDAFPQTSPGGRLTLVPYAAERHREFAQLVERTYVGSRDCLAMDTVRTVDDVLEGYRAAGNFDPHFWLVAHRAGREVGCLLLRRAETSSKAWEIVYLGIVPEARGHDFGLDLTREAQWMARQAGATRLFLAVDAENAPAISVYAAAGFVTWAERSVFLRVV